MRSTLFRWRPVRTGASGAAALIRGRAIAATKPASSVTARAARCIDWSRAGAVECFLTPAATADVSGWRDFDLDLPAGARVVGDKAYNDDAMQEVLATAGIHLCPFGKSTSKRPHPPHGHSLLAHNRKAVATTARRSARRFPKSIHATSAVGFELTVVLFVLAVSINCFPIL